MKNPSPYLPYKKMASALRQKPPCVLPIQLVSFNEQSIHKTVGNFNPYTFFLNNFIFIYKALKAVKNYA